MWFRTKPPTPTFCNITGLLPVHGESAGLPTAAGPPLISPQRWPRPGTFTYLPREFSSISSKHRKTMTFQQVHSLYEQNREFNEKRLSLHTALHDRKAANLLNLPIKPLEISPSDPS